MCNVTKFIKTTTYPCICYYRIRYTWLFSLRSLRTLLHCGTSRCHRRSVLQFHTCRHCNRLGTWNKPYNHNVTLQFWVKKRVLSASVSIFGWSPTVFCGHPNLLGGGETPLVTIYLGVWMFTEGFFATIQPYSVNIYIMFGWWRKVFHSDSTC